MLREKQFYKTFSVLALSLALHNLLSYSVNMMDMVMLGRYSQNAMSGVSLCNQVQFMLQMLVEGAAPNTGEKTGWSRSRISSALQCASVVAWRS